MNQSARAMLDSAEFKRMVTQRWTVSMILTAVLFLIYYGYIVLIAVDKPAGIDPVTWNNGITSPLKICGRKT